MPVNKTYIFLLPFFISTLSSCEKRFDKEEPIDTFIKPADNLEEVKDEITPED